MFCYFLTQILSFMTIGNPMSLTTIFAVQILFMKKVFLLSITILSLFGFAMANTHSDNKFNEFKEDFVLQLWKVYPAWASSVGYHKYDSVLVIPTTSSRNEEVEFCSNMLRQLHKFELESLSDVNKTDYHLIENQLQYATWSVKELKAWEWDPTTYNVCGSFADMLGNNYESLDTRLHNFYVRMDNVQQYYAVAKTNIKNPTIEHTQLAIDQNLGGLSVFEKDLDEAIKKSSLSSQEKEQIHTRALICIAAIKDYVNWLKNLDNKTPRSFRLGKDLYNQKFNFEIQSGSTADQIFAKAEQHKNELLRKMYRITEKLWPKYFSSVPMPEDDMLAIGQMIDALSKKHVSPDSFQIAIENQLPTLVKFIEKKNLIYIDPSKPLVVRREPDYMAGVAGASINAPGPYDKNGNTYYNVGSLDGWDADKAESYLREYNHYILQILNIHEAIPGHYTQLVYANQAPSIIKSILSNNAMVEGWAVYSELMMLENGYDGDNGIDSKEASPEMWLMYYKWNLRSTCNTILDYKVHTQNMSQAEAIKFLTEQAFQQKTEAEGKWKRVSVTQVQLCCYFTGYTEICELRETMKARQQGTFDLKKFHEQFLSYGSAPVKYIKELMLNPGK